MNEDIPDNKTEVPDFMRVARATRFAMVCIVLGLSLISFRISQGIPFFELLFKAIPGRDLSNMPLLTVYILKGRTLLLVLSLCLSAACIATFLIRDITCSLYCLGIIALIALGNCLFIYNALALPLSELIPVLPSVWP